ncbi:MULTISPECIES: glutaminase A [Metasolibacillus]|uniref:glutaminase A n=1 Tax=Metasolibacillus TaxID=2703677 RepID=UPI0007941A8B|nr:glutaminase A [Metasolibacillus fluoroglycofenilyticus]KYG92239.1 glutaminase A [[Bacillus] sp. KCTC 13219]
MQQLQQFLHDAQPFYKEGHVATYIPALSNVDPKLLAVSLIDGNGRAFQEGDYEHFFTLQSISKVISFIFVCETYGIEQVLKYVDVEPTGDPFNSIIRLESHQPGKPFNPMINAGAITISSMLPGEQVEEKVSNLQSFIQKITNERCEVSEEVFTSEWETAYRNRAIAYYLKANGYLQGDVEMALEAYLRQCALLINVKQLAMIALVIANDGYHPLLKQQIFDAKIAKIAKALMLTCGMYNASGKFAAFVGLPAKSGVSGGILCVAMDAQIEQLQGTIGIGIFGPAIDAVGNSVAGMRFLEELSKHYHLSIF